MMLPAPRNRNRAHAAALRHSRDGRRAACTPTSGDVLTTSPFSL
jgi:hypothetical protein